MNSELAFYNIQSQRDFEWRYGLLHPTVADLQHILLSRCSEEISLDFIITQPRGSHSTHPCFFMAVHHELTVEVTFDPLGLVALWHEHSVGRCHSHPSAPSSAMLPSLKPKVKHEPLPCGADWAIQAELTRPSVWRSNTPNRPFVTPTSCISVSLANSLSSDRSVSQYRQLLIYSLIITCLICSSQCSLSLGSGLPFCLPAICSLDFSASTVMFMQQYQKVNVKKNKHSSIIKLLMPEKLVTLVMCHPVSLHSF